MPPQTQNQSHTYCEARDDNPHTDRHATTSNVLTGNHFESMATLVGVTEVKGRKEQSLPMMLSCSVDFTNAAPPRKKSWLQFGTIAAAKLRQPKHVWYGRDRTTPIRRSEGVRTEQSAYTIAPTHKAIGWHPAAIATCERPHGATREPMKTVQKPTLALSTGSNSNAPPPGGEACST